jgi:hypothetical protein
MVRASRPAVFRARAGWGEPRSGMFRLRLNRSLVRASPASEASLYQATFPNDEEG